MNSSIPWLLISIIGVLIVLGIATAIAAKQKKEKCPPDYYALFVMGIVWTIIGFPLFKVDNYSLFTIGLVFLAIGLANRDKWKKNRCKWSDLKPEEKKLKSLLITGLAVLAIAGVVVYYFFR